MNQRRRWLNDVTVPRSDDRRYPGNPGRRGEVAEKARRPMAQPAIGDLPLITST